MHKMMVRSLGVAAASLIVVGMVWALGAFRGSSFHHVAANTFPRVPRATIVATRDDPPVDYGADRNYVRSLVLAGPSKLTSAELRNAEARLLARKGWRAVRPQIAGYLAFVSSDQPVRAEFITSDALRTATAWAAVDQQLRRALTRVARSGRPALFVFMTALPAPNPH